MANLSMKVVGKPFNRIDGRAKVTGRANYAADNMPDNLAYAVGVFSTIANGKIANLDTRVAEKMPGVLAILHHGNIPKLHRTSNSMILGTKVAEVRTPFEDNVVSYAGQWVAVVIADTFERARDASRNVKVYYTGERKPVITMDEGIRVNGAKSQKKLIFSPDTKRGNPAKAFAAAPVQIDATYETPTEVHNAMELHATVASWNGDNLEVYDSTQWVVGQRKALAGVLGIDTDKVNVRAPYIGGGFGGKLFLWPHTVIASLAAKAVNRPVKLMLERKSEFMAAGHRPETRQRIQLGASADGKLQALRHESLNKTSMVDEYLEECGETTRGFYSCPNLEVKHSIVPVSIGSPTPMRAPGSCPGMFAVESAMDELALALKMDPVELRRRNIPAEDEDKKIPWSSNNFEECLTLGAERFGWAKRNPEPGSMKDGGEILGWGMAASSWPAKRLPTKVKAQFLPDGNLRIQCATQDIGTGTYTIIAQVAAEVSGLPIEKIDVAIGQSKFPPGPISGGSMATASFVPAVSESVRDAIKALINAATVKGGSFAGENMKSLSFRDGNVVSSKGGKPASIGEVLSAARFATVEGEGKSSPGLSEMKHSFRSFGAHFVEVRWDPGIARLRVARVVAVMDTGRIMNHKTAESQLHGGIVMGVGMAMFEQSIYDERTGRVVTDNLADYVETLQVDTPQMDIHFLDKPDPWIGEFGARGLGEIGLAGIAAAITNATYHATGVRVRSLPITIEKLMT